MQDIFIGRQPVYNRNLGIHAYEMLFRAGDENVAGNDLNEDAATAQVIINTFMEMGLETLAGNSMVCINLTEKLILSEDILQLPADRTILDIQPTIKIDENTLAALQRLKEAGFKLALEGHEDVPDFVELVKLVDIFNLDIHRYTKEENKGWYKKLKSYGVEMRAVKVQSLDEYEEYMEMGFDYFQGYFLSHPRIIKGKALESNKLSILQLLSTLHNSESETATIEEAITADLSLSYKLLKRINSAFFWSAFKC